mmetsp:Transcript_15276/g.34151  ORF Transcript_15276/g.34151 Transcript_15276/m.34151 type:complete len:223 (-) Transcript_15276:937-1605(-)
MGSPVAPWPTPVSRDSALVPNSDLTSLATSVTVPASSIWIPPAPRGATAQQERSAGGTARGPRSNSASPTRSARPRMGPWAGAWWGVEGFENATCNARLSGRLATPAAPRSRPPCPPPWTLAGTPALSMPGQPGRWSGTGLAARLPVASGSATATGASWTADPRSQGGSRSGDVGTTRRPAVYRIFLRCPRWIPPGESTCARETPWPGRGRGWRGTGPLGFA